ncbi:SRPBCC family protein [Actinokineospora bangkokensis]|uniref:Activator of Hsp90 ATPase 1 family protein n=1 Tax=Actinokineospora bangkokensis TaxID=1193682 RepID=A0A1Q9LP46_9PSEU|nr:SRPBCC domain-containing protein [Actinokineospora bangkokensis]OLR93800.1 activator of Hsp90 ATPase 1 family protein [Actinokineospora bangkokensis]
MPTGLTKDAGWQIGVSRTLPHPLPAVWDLLTSPHGLATWVGPGTTLPPNPTRTTRYTTDGDTGGEVRGYRHHDRIRLTHGTTTIQTTVRATPTGTTLRFHQEHLTDADHRERQRTHWQHVIDRLATALDNPPT